MIRVASSLLVVAALAAPGLAAPSAAPVTPAAPSKPATAPPPTSAQATAALPASQPPLAAPVERRLHSADIDASSFLWNDWNKFVENYHPNYVADDDPATAWVEGAKTSGAGEWLKIQTTPLELTTKVRLRIRNGYQKSKDLFRANARVKQAKIRLLPSNLEKTVTLDDKDGWQDVAIEQPSGLVRGVELAVVSVYEGTKYADLCVSDIQVFATSSTPDNPAFEKSKHKQLMAWRAARLASAKQFKNQKHELPLYPAYEIASKELDVDGYEIGELVEQAKKDPAFKAWATALASADAITDDLDQLARAQVAPASPDELLEADGLQIARMHHMVGEETGMYDESALRLPMLAYESTLFADRLRMLDVKDSTKVSQFLESQARCKADVTWVKRSQLKEQAGPSLVQAIVVGRCARIDSREGFFNARAIELYVYDAEGRLALSIGRGHLDAYRWTNDNGRPMLDGGAALLSIGRRIEAKHREAVAAR